MKTTRTTMVVLLTLTVLGIGMTLAPSAAAGPLICTGGYEEITQADGTKIVRCKGTSVNNPLDELP